MVNLVVAMAPYDDVGVAVKDLAAGTELAGCDQKTITVREPIISGHKVALRDLAAGDLVHKYGQVIGQATTGIAAGSHVHDHNMGMPHDGGVRANAGYRSERAVLRYGGPRTFLGYRRADGRVATRNYIGLLTTVNCSATVAKKIAMRTEDDVAAMEGLEGVVAITHGTGCGMANQGPGWDLLRRTLLGYARHPNIAGVVVIGLGCEVNTMEGFMAEMELHPSVPVVGLTIQDEGGTAAAVAKGVAVVGAMARQLAGSTRTEEPVSHITLGLNCGGSDGWSGLTANPSLGVASDLLVAAGGTVVLGETPEVYGAEHLLTSRAATPVVAEALMERIRWWEQYTAKEGTSMESNPSPGNTAGGITTILEKSLGAVAKAGQSPLVGVACYGEPVKGEGRPQGLWFMDTPGYDPVSVTGLIAGGANLVCFTTGRGSVFGSRPAPTVKLGTNAELARRMAEDIDLDCSPVVEEGYPIADMGLAVYELLLNVASGRPSKSEAHGVGAEEFVPWQLGAVL